MTTKTFEASSVDEALAQAAQEFGVDAGDLQYEVQEKSEDFWGMGDTVFAVTVTAPAAEEPAQEEAPAPETPAPTPEPAVEAEAAPEPAEEPEAAPVTDAPTEEPTEDLPPFFSMDDDAPAEDATPEAAEAPVAADEAPTAETPVVEEEASVEPAEEPAALPEAEAQPAASESAPAGDGEDMTGEAVAILGRIFSAMGFECDAEAKLDGDTMHVAITGEDNQYLLEGRGRGLSALELILNHSFRAWPNRAHKRVRVDAGDFRSQRDDEIRDMAFQVAHRAKETGDEQQTAELNPYERRLVHLALSEDNNVTTRSLGNGFLKAVNVIPTRQRG